MFECYFCLVMSSLFFFRQSFLSTKALKTLSLTPKKTRTENLFFQPNKNNYIHLYIYDCFTSILIPFIRSGSLNPFIWIFHWIRLFESPHWIRSLNPFICILSLKPLIWTLSFESFQSSPSIDSLRWIVSSLMDESIDNRMNT